MAVHRDVLLDLHSMLVVACSLSRRQQQHWEISSGFLSFYSFHYRLLRLLLNQAQNSELSSAVRLSVTSYFDLLRRLLVYGCCSSVMKLDLLLTHLDAVETPVLSFH